MKPPSPLSLGPGKTATSVRFPIHIDLSIICKMYSMEIMIGDLSTQTTCMN